MNRTIRSAFLTLVAIAATTSVALSAPPAPRKIYTIQLNAAKYSQQMQTIQKAGLDVAGINFRKKTVDLVLTAAELTQLQTKILPAIAATERGGGMQILAPDAAYKTGAEIETILRDYVRTYPQLTELVEAGKSLEGRSIWALKITSSAMRSEQKPKILFNGMHHAREVMTPEVVLDIAEQLLTGYAAGGKARGWVDRNEIWLMPMFNVDGNNKVWTTDAMWRKNTRGLGTDINRNYPYNWGACNGSSGSQFAQDYRGTAAASEPETRVMMDLVARIKPVFDISFHSYSELVIYPYGCQGQHVLTQDVVESIGRGMAALLPSDTGRGNYTPGTSWETLYATDGGDIDWMYHEHGVIPYVIEVNSDSQGFQPSYAQWREPTVRKLRAAWSMLLDRLDGPSIRGKIEGANSNAALAGAQIVIERTGSLPQIEKTAADGTYHVVLNPGTYNVEFRATGYTSERRTITVADTRAVTNISLVATGTRRH